jgi:NAD(P)-dependent dehydrogenase (short-subunit alcohol dehydrogenase family)
MMSDANPLDLSGKVVLITGGAQGIGQATAQLCAQRGAAVVIADFNADGGESTAKGIRDDGGTADFFSVDVRESAQVEALLNFVREKHGRLDKMICAAGVLKGPWQTPEDLLLEDFMMTQDINVKGVFLCAKFATPLLEASHGVMIIVASGAGVTGPSSSLAYGASKGGANGLGMTLASHLAKRNIRVNVICPGNIVTQMKMSVDVARAESEGRPAEEAWDYARQNYGVPSGIARILCFMISDEADYLRGNVFTR